MSNLWTLADVDHDGAIQEAAERVDPPTRAAFLKKAGIGLGAVAGSGAVLGALLCENESTAVPATHALLALMCLHAARLPARIDSAVVQQGQVELTQK